MTSHPSRSYTLKTSSARPTPCIPSTAIAGRCAWQLRSPVLAHVLDSSFCSVVGGAFLLNLAASVYAPKFSSSFPFPVLALYFVLATWVQPSHPASPRLSFVSGANLVLTQKFFSFLSLSAAVLYCTVGQFWYHGRWYERSDLWIQLAVHRRCHWLCRYDHGTPGLLIVSSLTSTVWVHPGREAAGVHTRRCVFLLEGKGKTRKKPHRSCRRNVGNGADLGGNEEKT